MRRGHDGVLTITPSFTISLYESSMPYLRCVAKVRRRIAESPNPGDTLAKEQRREERSRRQQRIAPPRAISSEAALQQSGGEADHRDPFECHGKASN